MHFSIFPLQVFGGYLVNLNSMLNWLSWLKWISIFRYGLNVRFTLWVENGNVPGGDIINLSAFESTILFSTHTSCLSQAAFINEMTGLWFYTNTTQWELDANTATSSNTNHPQDSTHRLSLLCAAESQGSCSWKARTSTTLCGASGRIR